MDIIFIEMFKMRVLVFEISKVSYVFEIRL